MDNGAWMVMAKRRLIPNGLFSCSCVVWSAIFVGPVPLHASSRTMPRTVKPDVLTLFDALVYTCHYQLVIDPASGALARVMEWKQALRERIGAIDARENGGSFDISASFGVSATALSGYSLDRLMAQADEMMYASKQDGRNRVSAQGDTFDYAPVGPVIGPADRRDG